MEAIAMNSEFMSGIVKNAVNGTRVFKSVINGKVISKSIEKKLLSEKNSLLQKAEKMIDSFFSKRKEVKKNEILGPINSLLDDFLRNIVDIFDVTMSRRFKDRGLKFLDKQYIVYSTEVLLDNIFCVQETRELLIRIKQVGFLFFDLDGLKPVNEFASQLVGDNFLIAMAFIMSFGNQKISDFPELENFKSNAKEYCEENNLKVITSFFSEGDEYVALIVRTDDKELTAGDIHKLGMLFKEDMKQISTANMINFNSERTIEKCKKSGIGDLRDKVFDVYGEFEFPFTASFGVSTLETSLDVLIRSMQKNNEQSCDHSHFIYRLMRIFYQIAEDACKTQKAEYKKKISEQGLKGEFLENLFLRSDSGRKVALQNELLRKILFIRIVGETVELNKMEVEVLRELTNGNKELFQKVLVYSEARILI